MDIGKRQLREALSCRADQLNLAIARAIASCNVVSPGNTGEVSSFSIMARAWVGLPDTCWIRLLAKLPSKFSRSKPLARLTAWTAESRLPFINATIASEIGGASC